MKYLAKAALHVNGVLDGGLVRLAPLLRMRWDSARFRHISSRISVSSHTIASDSAMLPRDTSYFTWHATHEVAACPRVPGQVGADASWVSVGFTVGGAFAGSGRSASNLSAILTLV